jgi:glycosyltransferase involved in cell wall biosynthesis
MGMEDYGTILLACGRMSVAHKGFDVLLDLARKLPRGCTMVVNGKVPQKLEKQMLKNMVATTTAKEELPYLYSAADVLVHPSRYEGFGLVTAEAMSCGTPAVAFDTGAASELIGKNSGGIVIQGVRNGRGFLDAALKLANDEVLAKELGVAARKRVSGYTAEAMAKGYYEYYQRIIAEQVLCPRKR